MTLPSYFRSRHLAPALGFGLALSIFAQVPPAGAGRGAFGGVQPEIQLVRQFDQDGDSRLNAAERIAARQYLADNPQLRPSSGRAGRGGPGTSGPKLTPDDVTPYPDVPLYDSGTLRTLFLKFEDEDWEKQMAAFHRTDVEVPATLTVDGKTYRDVGVHFRGNNSFTAVPEGRKRSLTLSLDFVHEEQNLEGYRGLHLLNANQDPTFLRTVLYLDITRQYFPAPKANFVRVVINGESWGVYTNQQRFDKDFIRDAFKTTKGARWKSPNNSVGGGLAYLGDDVAAYKRWYELRSKDDPKAWQDLIRLCRVLDETPPEQLASALAPLLDIDGALAFIALDNALINNDGYWNDGSDYALYQDEKGRFHVLPHDVNEGFRGAGGRGGAGAGARLDPFATAGDTNKALLNKLLAVPELRSRYLAYIRDIAEKWLDWNRLGPLVEKYQALIRKDVESDTRKLSSTEGFTTGATGDESGSPPGASTLKGFAEQRREYLLSHPEVRKPRLP